MVFWVDMDCNPTKTNMNVDNWALMTVNIKNVGRIVTVIRCCNGLV